MIMLEKFGRMMKTHTGSLIATLMEPRCMFTPLEPLRPLPSFRQRWGGPQPAWAPRLVTPLLFDGKRTGNGICRRNQTVGRPLTQLVRYRPEPIRRQSGARSLFSVKILYNIFVTPYPVFLVIVQKRGGRLPTVGFSHVLGIRPGDRACASRAWS